MGDSAASNAALRELVEGFGDDAAFSIARVHAYRGDVDRAFDWLDRAYEQRAWGLVNVKADATFATLRSDPRWQPFLAQMGLAD